MAYLKRAASLLTLILVASCALPISTPSAPEDPVQLRLLRDRQDSGFRQKIDQWRRVYAIYSRLRTNDAEICEKEISPFWGVWLVDEDSLSPNDAERGKRLMNLGPQPTVLVVARNGQAAGLRPGDVITKIEDVVLKEQSAREKDQRRPKSQLTVAGEVLTKVTEEHADIEFEREGAKYTTQLGVETGCRYRLNVTESKSFDALSNSDSIDLPYEVVRFMPDDDKLAYVIAHEMAHHVLGHRERRETNAMVGGSIGAVVDLGLIVMGGLAGARSGSGNPIFSQIGSDVGKKLFSEEFNREADTMSVYFMVRAGFDPLKAQDIWRDLSNAEPNGILESYRSSHPSDPERTANFEAAVQRITGQIARNERLLPVKESANQPIGLLDAPNILQNRLIAIRQEQALPAVSAARRVIVEEPLRPVRYHAFLTQTKGLLMSIPPPTLDAEYFDNGRGLGRARVVFPGQIWEGEFRVLSYEESFKNIYNPRLLDPDRVPQSQTTSKKGFAIYSDPNGASMECSFSMSISGNIDQGRCLDTYGNEYAVSY